MNTFLTTNVTKLTPFICKSELGEKKHFDLKTGDRGLNTEHCQAMVTLGITAYKTHKEQLIALAAKHGYTLTQLMMAGTGRPFENRKSGKKKGGQTLANKIANEMLTELASLINVPRPNVKYNNCTEGLGTPAITTPTVTAPKVKPVTTTAPRTRKRKTAKQK